MKKQARNFSIEAVLLLLIIGSVAVAIITTDMKPLNKNDVQLTTADLRSFAAAGLQLIAQHQAGQLTETFYSTQVQLLEEKISSARQTLIDSNAAPDARPSQKLAGDLAAQMYAAVIGIQDSPQNGSAITGQLRSLEAKAKDLEERLKHE